MLRCVIPAALMAALAVPAAAQVQRNFPADALRGELLVAQAPDAMLNGQPARLAPGVRIRGQNNMLVVSGAATGQKLVVHYTVDTLGLIKDVWILTPEEMANKPWPTTSREAQSWAFDPIAQKWTKP
jgi:hypothetical protein